MWEKCIEFHGHECPGLAIGFRAAQEARKLLGIDFSSDEELVCITENDACGVDAIQVMVGCSLGKGNLLYRDTGKQAFSFFNRKTGQKIRLVLKAKDESMDRQERQQFILNAPFEQVFEIKTPSFNLPESARIFTTVICEQCGEGAPEPKIRLMNSKKICLDCFEGYSRGWQKD